ncbi:helix-turn-helix domain-containing protein [Parabacteroides pacaensis]|uniref:helix-turn-helix domain-containing protein n=1 Tax=Parabacteroides pacaensis TaxID=2086575 RepID=UPI000D1111FD|nr:helix-turn-helix domain-containing protein [Parabacteroides pacaensis]
MKDSYKEIVRSVPNSDCAFKYIELGRGVSLPSWDKEKNLLLFVLEGKLKLSIGEGSFRFLQKGSFILLSKGEAFKGTGMQPDSRLVIFLFNRVDTVWTSTKIKKLLDASDKKAGKPHEPLLIVRPLEMFLKLIVLYTEEKDIDKSFYANKESELLSLLYAFYSAEELGRMFYPLLHTNLDFKSFVEANYLKVESASELADLAGCSLVTLNRKFKEYFQDTAYQWIIKNKMVLILKRLQTPSGSLSEIAKEFGFYSGSELNRFCQRQFGTSALKLRKQAIGKKSVRKM